MKKPHAGFTLVELLIVIVVIAILAAISVVAYTSIQTRAKNSVTIDTVRKYYQALHLYATEHGEYPYQDTAVYYCLGSPYPEGTCSSRTGDVVYTVGRAQNNDTFNALLKPYMGGQLPLTMKEYINTESGIDIIGAYYQSSNRSIRYVIQDISCPPLPGASGERIGGGWQGFALPTHPPASVGFFEMLY